MNLRTRIASFRRRRIDIPVDHRALVLDVGSGDKPHWRADVLLDRHVGHEHGAQRSGRAAARVDRPMFEADAASMPFADQAFDYVICSHVLEHVERPDLVIAEMTRVAKAGYIEVPEAASAKIVDFPSHLWWCTMRDGVLVLTAKTTPWFDEDIHRYLTASGLRDQLAALLDRHLDHRVIELRWSTAVPHRVEGSVPPDMGGAAATDTAHHRGGETLAARALAAVMTIPLRGRRRRDPVRFDDVVRPELRTGTGEALRAEVYRLG